MRKILTILLPLLLSAPALAFAQQSEASLPDWEQLSTRQRAQLVAPLRDRWNSSDPDTRRKMLEHAERWQSMTPEQRARASHGHDRWKHMSPERRAEARALFEHMRTLPEAERKALIERWRTMTPDQRKAWVEAHPPRGRDDRSPH
jgi:hypothetical protein